jgi:ketosteroid isomerase-like protein
MDPSSDDPNGQVVLRFMAGTASGDLDSVAGLVHDDFVMVWPQSGERFSGRDNAFAAMRAQQEKPEVAGEPRLVGSGNVWVLMMPLRYGAGTLHYVAVLELEDGKIRRATGHWGAPFPAQDYRAEFADRD